MSLRLEADRQGNLDKRNFGPLEQFFGTLDPSLQDILVGPQTHRRPELRGEVHPAQACDRCQVLQRDLCVEMIVHILQHSLETPFLQRPDVSTEGLLCIGSLATLLPAELPCQNGQAQGVGADPGVKIVRGFGCREGLGKTLDDGVIAVRRSMRGILGTTVKTLGGNLEAGSAFPRLFGIGMLSCDRDGDIEMSQRQRRVVGESSLR
jgi:hypothetical protein